MTGVHLLFVHENIHGITYLDVDYQANLNLLREAEQRSGQE